MSRPKRLFAQLGVFEWLVVAALLLLSFVVLAGLLVRVWRQGGVVSGSDSYLVLDQMQYLDWIGQASRHGLIENLYDGSQGGPRWFLHPLVLLSGGLHALGVGVVVAYVAWKPVAVLALFAAAFAYTRRFLPRQGDRRLALVLALFTCLPVAAFFDWTNLGEEITKVRFDFLTGEAWTGTFLWGYPFTAIAVALLPAALLLYERGRRGGRGGLLVWAAVSGFFCSWLQPWQGATLIIVLVAAEAVVGARAGGQRGVALRDGARDLILPVGAAVLPLLYYLVLGERDPSWELAALVNDGDRWPWWVTVLGLAPLAVPAAFAYRLAAPAFGDIALRMWPLAALLVFYQPAGTHPFHALQGIALPLAVLAVVAVRHRLGERALPAVGVAAVVTLLVVPGTIQRGDDMRGAVNYGLQPHFFTAEERAALRHLEEAEPDGTVLTPLYSGQVVPAYTGREAWVGSTSWTPDFQTRTAAAEKLFAGKLSRRDAESLIRDSGATFLLSDCHGRADITRLVGRVARLDRRFGCAAVYRVRTPS